MRDKKNKILQIEEVIFYSLIFFLPFQARVIVKQWGSVFNEWNSVFFYLTDWLILAVLFLWLRRVLRREAKVKLGRLEFGLALFLFFGALSLFRAENLGLGVYKEVKLIEFGLIFLYVKNNFRGLVDAGRFFKVLAMSGVLQALTAIIQFGRQASLGLRILDESPLAPDLPGVAKIVVGGAKVVRAYGLTPHPNVLAAFLILAIFGLVYLFVSEYQKLSRTKNLIYGSAGVILLLSLFLTFSRIITVVGLGFLTIWLLFLLFQDKRFRRPVSTALILLFAVSGLLLAVYWPYVAARYSGLDLADGQAINLRTYYNQVALDLMSQRPLGGVGQGNFVVEFFKQRPGLENWLYQPVHNVYLLIAVQSGVLSLLAFLWFLFLIIRGAWSRRNDLSVSCLLLIVNCLLLIALFDHFLWDLQQGQIVFWLFLGILATVGHSERSEELLVNESNYK